MTGALAAAFQPHPDLSEFDCVVFLTWSDWKSEPRSNRYHYATRFARHLPVLFVQPDIEIKYPLRIWNKLVFEESNVKGISLLHVSKHYGERQTKMIAKALLDKGYRRPLLWIYNPLYKDFISQCPSTLRVFHATEDYFKPNYVLPKKTLNSLTSLWPNIDLMVAVTNGVAESYKSKGGYAGRCLVLPNGCDFEFWQHADAPKTAPESRPVAFFQGGVNSRLDVSLLEYLCDNAPDWDFWICGRKDPEFRTWSKLENKSNLRYFGDLSPEGVRTLTHQATVGIIPYVQDDYIFISLPLKAYEYVACGLPVVSVPIAALSNSPYFSLAAEPHVFLQEMRKLAPTRFDSDKVTQRLKEAALHSYDNNFSVLLGSEVGKGSVPRNHTNLL